MFRNKYAAPYDWTVGKDFEESEVSFQEKHYFLRGLMNNLAFYGLKTDYRDVISIEHEPSGKGFTIAEDKNTGEKVKIHISFWFDMGPGVLVSSSRSGGASRFSFKTYSRGGSFSSGPLGAATEAAAWIATGQKSSKFASSRRVATLQPQMDEGIDLKLASTYTRQFINSWRANGFQVESPLFYEATKWKRPVAFTHKGTTVYVTLQFRDETSYGDGQQVIVQVVDEMGNLLHTQRDILAHSLYTSREEMIELFGEYNDQGHNSAKFVLKRLGKSFL
jgi:hypothetical protein